MSSGLLALVLMQYVVSVKAGLVNHVQGTANVAEMEMARPGHPIQTGADGYVEVLLTPGSFLRLGENSAVVLDGVQLESVSLHLVDGPAVIEVIEIDKNHPIKVTTGKLTMNVVAPGIYRFADGIATVLDGKLQTPGSKLSYEKGWQVFFQDNYRARKVGKIQVTSLDVFSRARSQAISNANFNMANLVNPSYGYGTNPFWLFAPNIGFYTYMPWGNYRSPYGYQYYGIGNGHLVPRVNRSYSSVSTSSGGGTTQPSSPPPSTGNSGGDSGGGGGGAPAITVSTPSGERSAPAVYIESKSTPVGATQ
jgi:FecR-like protein